MTSPKWNFWLENSRYHQARANIEINTLKLYKMKRMLGPKVHYCQIWNYKNKQKQCSKRRKILTQEVPWSWTTKVVMKIFPSNIMKIIGDINFFFPQKNDPKIFINIFYDRIHRKLPLGKNLFTEAMRGKNCVIMKLQRINLLGY